MNPHYLKRTGKGKLWDGIVGIGWDRRLHLVPASAATYDVSMGEASFAHTIFRLDGRRSLSITQTDGERSCLEALCDFARGKGRILAVADDARLLFDASSSWRFLEEKVKQYGIPVQPKPPNGYAKAGTVASAFILPESRPFVVSLKMPAEQVDITLCCLSSFGARRVDDTRTIEHSWCVSSKMASVDALESYSVSLPEAVRVAEHVLSLQSACCKINNVSVQVTAGGTASTLFRSTYLDERILCTGDSDENRFARLCYHGGRCESSVIGSLERFPSLAGESIEWDKERGLTYVRGGIVHLDFSSMYPALYTACDLPCRFSHTTTGGSMDDAEALAKRHCGLVRAMVTTSVPCVPLRVRRGAKGSIHPITPIETYEDLDRGCYTIFPTGTFETFVPFPELRRLRLLGGSFRIVRADWYERGTPLAAYGRALAAQRVAASDAGDAATVGACKLLMNSITGKLAPREKRWVEVEPSADAEGWECWSAWNREFNRVDTYRNILGRTYRLDTGGETENSAPFLPAYITSLARVLLDRAIDCAGRDSVFYYDTDSIFTTHGGLQRLQAGGYVKADTPGKMRIVGVYDRMDIVGFKAYRCDGKLTLSGVTDKYEEIAPGLVRRESDKIEVVKPGDDRAPSKRLTAFTSQVGRPYVHGEVGARGKVYPWTLSMVDNEGLQR